jgi:hypothetical protein
LQQKPVQKKNTKNNNNNNNNINSNSTANRPTHPESLSSQAALSTSHCVDWECAPVTTVNNNNHNNNNSNIRSQYRPYCYTDYQPSYNNHQYSLSQLILHSYTMGWIRQLRPSIYSNTPTPTPTPRDGNVIYGYTDYQYYYTTEIANAYLYLRLPQDILQSGHLLLFIIPEKHCYECLEYLLDLDRDDIILATNQPTNNNNKTFLSYQLSNQYYNLESHLLNQIKPTKDKDKTTTNNNNNNNNINIDDYYSKDLLHFHNIPHGNHILIIRTKKHLQMPIKAAISHIVTF